MPGRLPLACQVCARPCNGWRCRRCYDEARRSQAPARRRRSLGARGPRREEAGRAERLAEFARRAALELPLFDGPRPREATRRRPVGGSPGRAHTYDAPRP